MQAAALANVWIRSGPDSRSGPPASSSPATCSPSRSAPEARRPSASPRCPRAAGSTVVPAPTRRAPLQRRSVTAEQRAIENSRGAVSGAETATRMRGRDDHRHRNEKRPGTETCRAPGPLKGAPQVRRMTRPPRDRCTSIPQQFSQSFLRPRQFAAAAQTNSCGGRGAAGEAGIDRGPSHHGRPDTRHRLVRCRKYLSRSVGHSFRSRRGLRRAQMAGASLGCAGRGSETATREPAWMSLVRAAVARTGGRRTDRRCACRPRPTRVRPAESTANRL